MHLKRTLIGIVRSHETTGEQTKYPDLRTRYYQLSRDKVWDEIVDILSKRPGYKLLHEVKSVGEIVAEKKTALGRTQDITITLFVMNPVRTAVDIYSASRGSLGDFGSNYRTIMELFRYIDEKLKDYKVEM